MAEQHLTVVMKDSSSSRDQASTTAGRSTKALTDRLVRLIDGYINKREGRNRLENTLYMLKTQRLRHTTNAGTFLQHGGLDGLLQLSRKLELTLEGDCKLLAAIWSTVANLCALNEQVQVKILQSSLADISKILCTSSYPDLMNTIARTIGNLVSHSQFLKASEGHISTLVRELTQVCCLYTDPGCIQSVLRALRKLITHADIHEDFITCQTIPVIANCIKLNDNAVILSTLNTLEACIIGGHTELVSSLWSLNHESLDLICGCVQHPDNTLQQKATYVLCSCAKHADGKAALSRAGGIEVLVQFLSMCDKSTVTYNDVIEALCHCCRDVHSRQKMRDCGGLQLIIDLLRDEDLLASHEDILSALICYYFDEPTLRYMIRCLGLMRSLVYHLTQMTTQIKEDSSIGPSHSQSPILTIPDSSNIGDTPDSLALELAERGSDIYIDCKEFSSKPSIEVLSCDSPNITASMTSGLSLSIISPSPSSFLAESERELSPSLSNVSSPIPSENLTYSQDVEDIGTPLSPIFDVSSFDDSLHSSQFSSLSVTFSKLKHEDSIENLCSTISDTTPQRSTKLKLDLDSSTPMPANFIDSLLSSPSLYSTPNPPSFFSPYTSPQNNTDNRVLLLLSRVSHLHDCQPVLASQDVLSVILEFFLASGPTNIQCFKVLGRLFSNPHCFQDCLLTLAPSLIFHHMTHYSTCKIVPTSEVEPSQHSLVSQMEMCQQLLDKLTHVAESPYGQGVIAHMLLRGDSHEVIASSLALILLERSHVVCQKMLLNYYGLHNLLQLSQGKLVASKSMYNSSLSTTIEEDNDLELNKDTTAEDAENDKVPESTQLMSIGTLLFLAHHFHLNPARKRRHSYTSDRSVTSPRQQSFQKLFRYESTPPEILYTKEPSPSPIVAAPTTPLCLYRDFDHWPFDTIIYLDSGHTFPVHHCLLIESSDVFAVMLSGRYHESSSSDIHLHKVPPAAFKSLLHHMYGCSFTCCTDTINCCHSDDNNEDYEMDLINEIISPLDKGVQPLVKHFLQVLICSNQFFVSTLLVRCEQYLQDYLKVDNIVPMFLFSQLHQSHSLARKCIQYFVSMKYDHKQNDIFKELIESQDSKKFLQMIEDLFCIDNC